MGLCSSAPPVSITVEPAEARAPPRRREHSISRRSPSSMALPSKRRTSISTQLTDRADREFEYMQILGQGSFGKVVRVRRKDDGIHYAMKIVDKSAVMKDLGKEFCDAIREEIKVLDSLAHPFVVDLVYNFENKYRLYMVMELVRGPTLDNLLTSKQQRWPENKARLFAAEVLLALEHMHAKGIVYRDLKPDNIMFDEEGHVRMTDLGVACRLGGEHKTERLEVGGRGFKAPEMLQGKDYDYSVDWWNFGVLIFQVIMGRHPFSKRLSVFNQLDKSAVKESFKAPSKGMSPEAGDLVEQLLRRDPAQRLGCTSENKQAGAVEVKNHPFFAVLDWQLVEERQYDAVSFLEGMEEPIPELDPNELASFRDIEHVMEEFKYHDKEQLLGELIGEFM